MWPGVITSRVSVEMLFIYSLASLYRCAHILYHVGACFFKGWGRKGKNNLSSWLSPSQSWTYAAREWVKERSWGGVPSQTRHPIYVTDLHGPMEKLGKCSEMRAHDHNVEKTVARKKKAHACRRKHTNTDLIFHNLKETQTRGGYPVRGSSEQKCMRLLGRIAQFLFCA